MQIVSNFKIYTSTGLIIQFLPLSVFIPTQSEKSIISSSNTAFALPGQVLTQAIALPKAPGANPIETNVGVGVGIGEHYENSDTETNPDQANSTQKSLKAAALNGKALKSFGEQKNFTKNLLF